MVVPPRNTGRMEGALLPSVRSLALALPLIVMGIVLCLAMTMRVAYAESVTTGVSISSQDGTTHTYAAHKLLAGEFQGTSIPNPSLEGCVPVAAYRAAGASENDVKDADAVATWLSINANSDADGSFTATLARAVLQTEAAQGLAPATTFSSGVATGLSSGYWLVTCDKAQPMLIPVRTGQVVEAQEKSTTPVPTKLSTGSVSADGTSSSGASATTAGWGDVVSYRLESTLPSNLAAFTSYRLWLQDSVDQSFEYVADSVRSYIRSEDGTTAPVDLKVNIDGHQMRVGTDDLMQTVPSITASDVVVVEYSCVMGPTATLGLSHGNKNVFTIRYSCSPTNNETESMSVESQVEAYAFEIDTRLVDASQVALADASFVIQNDQGAYRTSSNTWVKDRGQAQVTTTDDQGLMSFPGLAAGTYTLVETKAPTGYDTIADPVKVTLELTGEDAEGLVAMATTGSGTTTLEDAATSSLSLTATAAGSGATVTAVDAASGVATVQIEHRKSSSGGGTSGGGTSGGGTSGGTGASTQGNAANPVAVATNTLSSLLPQTADPSLVVGGGLLVAAAGFIIVGKKKRHDQTDDGNEAGDE